MMRANRSESVYTQGRGAIMSAAFLAMVAATALVIGNQPLAAQAPAAGAQAKPAVEFPAAPTTTTVPIEFMGTWRGNNPRGSTEFGGNCGSLKDHYGNPRELCEFPVDKLEPFMNGRMRAWIEFFDETMSPRWTCVAAGIQTGLQEGYLWEFSATPDALVQRWEQSAWVREIWMDGRPHPSAMRSFYHGHSIGKVVSPTEIVVDTTNFTFDPDGWDDHSHLATSHRKHLIERYMITGPDTMILELTVEDPIFLKAPFTWRKQFRKTQQPFVSKWDCDPEAGLDELYRTIPQKYPDDTEFQKYNK
jgi:hypothetical protein